MNTLTFFLIQVGLNSVLCLLIARRMSLPLIIKLLLVVCYSTAPVFVAVRGVASAVYLSDLFGFILILYHLAYPKFLRQLKRDRFLLTLSLLLVVLPAFTSLIVTICGFQILDLRNIAIQGLWFYRNVLFLAAYEAVAVQDLTEKQVRAFIRLNLSLGLLLASVGILSYVRGWDLALYEALVTGSPVSETRGTVVGAGFLGLFRGSVGPWFATLCILGLVNYSSEVRIWRKISLLASVMAVIVLAFSFSRAGLLGLLVGLMMVVVFPTPHRMKRTLRSVAVALAVLFLLFLQGPQELKDRYLPTQWEGGMSSFDPSASSRLRSWRTGLSLISSNLGLLLIGIGPTNREGVYELIGLFGAHNEYLDVIFRMGVLGFVLLMLTLYTGLRRLTRKRKTEESSTFAVSEAGVAILIANAVMGITQTHLLHDHATYTWGFYLYTLYGLLIGGSKRADTPQVAPSQSHF